MDEDDLWRLRVRYTCIGLGKLTVGGYIMACGLGNVNISNWALPQIAFGGAMVTSGMLHISLAWNMDPPPPPIDIHNHPNGLARNIYGRYVAPQVGIPLAEDELGNPDLLAGEGQILHQNLPPVADGIRNVGEANLHNVGEAPPAKFEAGESRAGSGGLLRRRHVQQAHEDQEIGDNNEFDPDNAAAEVGQAEALEEVGQADDVEESNQTDNEGELGQGTDESESVNEAGLAKKVGEVEPTNEVNVPGQASNIDKVNAADSLENIEECADKDDVTSEGEPDIELPRSSVALSLDIPSIKFIDSGESDCESSY